MKKLTLLTTTICLLISSISQAQIVINEVIFTPAQAVEIKNIGPSTVDISSYQLCSFPTYNALSSLSVVTGNLNLGPGELVVVSGHAFSSADDEMGLYISGPFGESDNILDYVEWGSAGHTRSITAQEAGIWSASYFVSVDAGGASIEYDGEGDAPSDWLLASTNSQGAENSNAGGGGCDAGGIVVGSQSICPGGTASFNLILSGFPPYTVTYSLNGVLQPPFTTSDALYSWELSEAGQYSLVSVEDANCVGEASGFVEVTLIDPPVASVSPDGLYCSNDSLAIDMTGVGPWTVSYQVNDGETMDTSFAITPGYIPTPEEGEYTLLTVENFSCPGTVTAPVIIDFVVEGGALTQSGTDAGMLLCVDDGISDETLFEVGDPTGAEMGLIITNEMGVVLDLPLGSTIDFEGGEAGICLIHHISYESGLTGLAVGNTVPDDLEGCYDLSNAITVQRETGIDCTTGLQEIAGLQALSLYPNPAQELLNISYALERPEVLELLVMDMQGQVLLREQQAEALGAQLISLDVQTLAQGSYVLSLRTERGAQMQRLFTK